MLDAVTSRVRPGVVTFTQGLYKIFDEILVNAAVNKQRGEPHQGPAAQEEAAA